MTDRLISLNAAIEAVLSVPPGTPCRGLAIREALCALPDAGSELREELESAERTIEDLYYEIQYPRD